MITALPIAYTAAHFKSSFTPFPFFQKGQKVLSLTVKEFNEINKKKQVLGGKLQL